MATFKYRAFLSYSHRDTAWAKWLHRALESYRVDQDLVGRETPHGPVPKTLRPIFRDREDFSAGHSLTDQTIAALEASQFLIAICSPNAARSQYVNEEIRHFKALGRGAWIIPVIIGGEPGDPERECFPAVIRFRLDTNGVMTDQREEPIAADARPQGDGKEIAKRKVIAGLLGLGLDEIMRRAERARKRRNRFRIGMAGGAAVVLSVAVLGWTGAVSFSSQLDTSQQLNIDADAAYLCERAIDEAAEHTAVEAQRIAVAVKCIDVLGEGLGGLPQGTHVPLRLISALDKTVASLQEFQEAGKLTSQQMASLAKIELLLGRIKQR